MTLIPYFKIGFWVYKLWFVINLVSVVIGLSNFTVYLTFALHWILFQSILLCIRFLPSLQERIKMGILFSQIMNKLFGNIQSRISMVGLDAAGKTTILYKLRLGENVCTIPTIGFNVEEIVFQNLTMTVWDIGGQKSIR